MLLFAFKAIEPTLKYVDFEFQLSMILLRVLQVVPEEVSGVLHRAYSLVCFLHLFAFDTKLTPSCLQL